MFKFFFLDFVFGVATASSIRSKELGMKMGGRKHLGSLLPYSRKIEDGTNGEIWDVRPLPSF